MRNGPKQRRETIQKRWNIRPGFRLMCVWQCPCNDCENGSNSICESVSVYGIKCICVHGSVYCDKFVCVYMLLNEWYPRAREAQSISKPRLGIFTSNSSFSFCMCWCRCCFCCSSAVFVTPSSALRLSLLLSMYIFAVSFVDAPVYCAHRFTMFRLQFPTGVQHNSHCIHYYTNVIPCGKIFWIHRCIVWGRYNWYTLHFTMGNRSEKYSFIEYWLLWVIPIDFSNFLDIPNFRLTF